MVVKRIVLFPSSVVVVSIASRGADDEATAIFWRESMAPSKRLAMVGSTPLVGQPLENVGRCGNQALQTLMVTRCLRRFVRHRRCRSWRVWLFFRFVSQKCFEIETCFAVPAFVKSALDFFSCGLGGGRDNEGFHDREDVPKKNAEISLGAWHGLQGADGENRVASEFVFIPCGRAAEEHREMCR